MRMVMAFAVMVFGWIQVLASDILIRARGLDGKYGLSADSYDWVGSILLGAGAALFLFAFFQARRGNR